MAKQIAEFMNVTANMQRMDSLMIATNIKNLSVSVLFYTCVAALAKITVQRKSNLPEKQYQYIKKDVINRCIYYKKESRCIISAFQRYFYEFKLEGFG